MKKEALLFTFCESPIGRLLLAGDGKTLHYLSFPSGHKAFGPAPTWRRSDAAFDNVKDQLARYFAGTLTRFDLPLTMNGTAFQKSVWALLCDIPFGETRTYADLARSLGKPKAYRAVGAANGSNPIPGESTEYYWRMIASM